MPDGGSLLLPLQAFSEDAFPSTLPQEVDERFSTLLQQMLPQFVVDDHPLFVSFLRAYLEFSEQHGNPRAEAVLLNEYIDVDKTLPEFLTFFKSQYLHDFPPNLYKGLNEQQVIKNIKDYYGEKGNPRSLDLLFRILYNTKVEVKFPREQVIVASESSYEQRTTVFTTRFNGEKLLDYVGTKLLQNVNTDRPDQGVRCTAFVDSIEFREFEGIDYAEIKLRDQFGTYVPSRQVLFVNETGQFLEEDIFSVITTAEPKVISGITQDGQNYSVGDEIIVRDEQQKIISRMKVNDVSSTGEIQKISNSFTNRIYFANRNYTFDILTAGGTGADLQIVSTTAESFSTNPFTTEKSILSANSFLQNNFNYQEFSYVISSDIQLSAYAKLVKTLFHPAGSMLLGEYVFNQSFDSAGLTTDIRQQPNIPILGAVIGNYFPYTIATTADLRGDTYGSTFADYYPLGFDGITANAATFGNFDSSGAGVTHVPLSINGTFLQTGSPIYSEDMSPEAVQQRVLDNPNFRNFVLPGYTLAAFPQVTMTATDNAASEFYIVHRHPNTLLGEGLTETQVAAVNKNIRKDTTTGKTKQVVKRVTFTISSNSDGTGVVSGLGVGQTITQPQVNNPTAIGTIVSVQDTLVSNIPKASFREVTKSSRASAEQSNPFTQVSVITVDVTNGSFVNTIVESLTSSLQTQQFVVSSSNGTRFFVGGVGGTDAITVSEALADLSFGNVRISDFFDGLQTPILD